MSMLDEVRRRALLPIAPSMLLWMLRGLQAGHQFSVTGLPEDVHALAVQYDWLTDRIFLVLESESFEPLPNGAQLPSIQVVITETITTDDELHAQLEELRQSGEHEDMTEGTPEGDLLWKIQHEDG